jgi:phage terminase large subunit-like protein
VQRTTGHLVLVKQTSVGDIYPLLLISFNFRREKYTNSLDNGLFFANNKTFTVWSRCITVKCRGVVNVHCSVVCAVSSFSWNLTWAAFCDNTSVSSTLLLK